MRAKFVLRLDAVPSAVGARDAHIRRQLHLVGRQHGNFGDDGLLLLLARVAKERAARDGLVEEGEHIERRRA